MDKALGLLVFARCIGQEVDGAVEVSVGVQVAAGFGGHFATFGADGHAAVFAHAHAVADAPELVPPRLGLTGAQGVAFGASGAIPCALRGHAQVAVEFSAVVVIAELLQQVVGTVDVADVLGGEEGGQPIPPVMVQALDFAFGLRGGCIEQAPAVVMEGGSESGECVGIVGVEEAMVVHVESQWQAVGEEGAANDILVASDEFALIQACACDHA